MQKRGGKGVKCYRITEKTGNVVGIKAVNEDHEIMMITTEGVIIQIPVGEISTYSRNTSGVKLINLDNDNVRVARIAKVREKLSDGTQEFEDVEEALDKVVDDSPEELETTESVDAVMDELIERAMADGEADGDPSEDTAQEDLTEDSE